MSFQSYIKKLEEVPTKNGSLADKIKTLIKKRELLRSPMTSSEICDVLYEITGHRIHNIVPFLLVFQKHGILRRRKLPNSKEILWFGSWDAKNVETSAKSDPLNRTLVKSFGTKFQKEFRDLSFVYGRSGTCSAFMFRKILEKSTFMSLVKNGVSELSLKDASGKYLGLETLLQKAGTVRVNGIPILLPKTLSKIQGIKYLGDVSAHNYLVNVDVDDLMPQVPFIVIGLKEIARCL